MHSTRYGRQQLHWKLAPGYVHVLAVRGKARGKRVALCQLGGACVASGWERGALRLLLLLAKRVTVRRLADTVPCSKRKAGSWSEEIRCIRRGMPASDREREARPVAATGWARAGSLKSGRLRVWRKLRAHGGADGWSHARAAPGSKLAGASSAKSWQHHEVFPGGPLVQY